MSYSENLCEKSLKLIFKRNVTILRNYRPKWLRNPKTGKNLEMDFYLPHIKMALEIQGQHHYDNEHQIENDLVKEQLLIKHNIILIKLSIFQISPSILYTKIKQYTYLLGHRSRLKTFDINWTKLKEIKDYKEKILNIYGKSKCVISPYTNEDEQRKRLKMKVLDEKIMSTIQFNYKFNSSGIVKRITPIEILTSKDVKCRILGSDKFIIVNKKCLIDV